MKVKNHETLVVTPSNLNTKSETFEERETSDLWMSQCIARNRVQKWIHLLWFTHETLSLDLYITFAPCVCNYFFSLPGWPFWDVVSVTSSCPPAHDSLKLPALEMSKWKGKRVKDAASCFVSFFLALRSVTLRREEEEKEEKKEKRKSNCTKTSEALLLARGRPFYLWFPFHCNLNRRRFHFFLSYSFFRSQFKWTHFHSLLACELLSSSHTQE